ncbi:MAG TPA: hypothetical protein PLI43_15400 [Albidovulum sp.]|uniref:hypothetical protein n=1 Tax=Albidovulum sp. TaxID=1872424 RepID=UPI002BEAEC8C|nr:hypothetical protein [Albidovulum sp.]
MIPIVIDALRRDNERGFGHLTRNRLAAPAAHGTGLHNTLLCDRDPERPVPASVDVVIGC